MTRGETFRTFGNSPPGDFYDEGGELCKGAKIVRDTGRGRLRSRYLSTASPTQVGAFDRGIQRTFASVPTTYRARGQRPSRACSYASTTSSRRSEQRFSTTDRPSLSAGNVHSGEIKLERVRLPLSLNICRNYIYSHKLFRRYVVHAWDSLMVKKAKSYLRRMLSLPESQGENKE